jgi:DNA primase
VAVNNKPLTFQLKGIDPRHPYLAFRGINPEIAERFGVGYFGGKGLMAGRVVIPIHNQRGRLVAYAGRAIDIGEPRYKLPVGYHKSLELFNLHRARGERNTERRVVLVEGFFDCIKVAAAGFACVALMGNSMSEAQEHLLGQHFDKICLLMDGDAAGQEAAETIAQRLTSRLYVEVINLPEGKQPDQLGSDEIRSLMEKQRLPTLATP